jgi:hypothetical protein
MCSSIARRCASIIAAMSSNPANGSNNMSRCASACSTLIIGAIADVLDLRVRSAGQRHVHPLDLSVAAWGVPAASSAAEPTMKVERVAHDTKKAAPCGTALPERECFKTPAKAYRKIT